MVIYHEYYHNIDDFQTSEDMMIPHMNVQESERFKGRCDDVFLTKRGTTESATGIEGDLPSSSTPVAMRAGYPRFRMHGCWVIEIVRVHQQLLILSRTIPSLDATDAETRTKTQHHYWVLG